MFILPGRTNIYVTVPSKSTGGSGSADSAPVSLEPGNPTRPGRLWQAVSASSCGDLAFCRGRLSIDGWALVGFVPCLDRYAKPKVENMLDPLRTLGPMRLMAHFAESSRQAVMWQKKKRKKKERKQKKLVFILEEGKKNL